MPIMNTVIAGGGSPTPAHYIEFPVDANGELAQPTTTSALGSIKIVGNYALQGVFAYNRNITSIDLSSVEIIKTNGCSSMFGTAVSALVSANFESVVYCGDNGLGDFARSSSQFTTFIISSLKTVGSNGFSNAFRSASVTSLSFPALKNVASNSFNLMIQLVSNCTIHFPANMQTTVEALTGYPNFGGTNTSVLFDLPATVILTGANSQAYERNPKYDTATSLAWRVQDTGTEPNLVIDWTPFYTSGTTDPAVNDTIYSDSACTTAVTTISSIA